MAESAHFKDVELACHCGCGRQNVKEGLLSLLECARVLNGNRPMSISSASRCPAREVLVSGRSNGAHVDGDAVDIRCSSDLQRLAWVRIFLSLGIRRLGIAATFIHVDISKTRAQDVLWTYEP